MIHWKCQGTNGIIFLPIQTRLKPKALTNMNISQCVNKINKDPVVLEKKCSAIF